MDRTRDVGIAAYQDGALSSRDDVVATEEPLEIRLSGRPLAVIMRTPGDDLELAAGFLHAEGIIRHSDDLVTLRHCTSGEETDQQNIVDVVLSPARAESTEARAAEARAQRATITSASCGVCGKERIEALHVDCPPFESPPELKPDYLATLPRRLREAQEVFMATGGLHGAAVFDADGALRVAREDVGRHNAVDKCVGFLVLREQLPVRSASLVVSGRTSFEIIQKALLARIQVVAAVSAPSSLAVELARTSNMGLAGFVRDGNLNIYSGFDGASPERAAR